MNDLLLNHQKLLSKGSEAIDHITARLQGWETFQQSMASLSDWLDGGHAEMDDISRYYMYLQSFQDILDRHQVCVVDVHIGFLLTIHNITHYCTENVFNAFYVCVLIKL